MLVLYNNALTCKTMVITAQCQAERCNECPRNVNREVECEHRCHQSTLDVSSEMGETLRQQQVEQEKQQQQSITSNISFL